MNRRNFIKNLAVTVGGIAPLLSASGLSLIASNLLADEMTYDGYKAIVIINLSGGNDSMNNFPPTAPEAYTGYVEARPPLAVANNDLSLSILYTKDTNGYYAPEAGDKQPYWAGGELGAHKEGTPQYTIGSYHTRDENGDKTGLGIHALMPEIAALYDRKKLSIVSNIGTLLRPRGTSGSSHPHLYSHLHQSKAVGCVSDDLAAKTGWAGRLLDLRQEDSTFGQNVSLGGAAYLFKARNSGGFFIDGPVSSYDGGEKTHKRIKDLSKLSETNNLKRVYNERMAQTVDDRKSINDTWSSIPSTDSLSAKNTYGDELFNSGGDNVEFRTKLGMGFHHGLSTDLLTSLKKTVRLLQITKANGSNRQVFNVEEGGYDFHSGQVQGHSKKMRALSMGVSDFYKAIEELGMEKEVLVILTSEFGRSLVANGDGTDHGWGGHGFMMCGDDSFNGGRVFGEVIEDLSPASADTATSRNRLVPTTSVEQMLAPALEWFGADSVTMDLVLPNLAHFRTNLNDDKSSYLQGVFS